MGEPPHELLPSRALFPHLRRKQRAVLAVVVEEPVEGSGGARGKDKSIGLVVVAQAAAVQVGSAYGAVAVVYGHHFGMVEASVEEVDACAALHQLMYVIECGFGSKGHITDTGNHDFHLYASFQCLLQGGADGLGRYEIGIDDAYSVARTVDGSGVGMTDGTGRFTGHPVYDGYFFCFLSGNVDVGNIFGSSHVLACLPVPRGQENALQVSHGIAINTHVHVVPLSYLGQAGQVVVGYVHATRIARLSVDDNNFPVVSVQGVVDVGKGDGVEFHQFYASGPDGLDMLFAQRFVVRPVAESIEQSTYFHTFLYFLRQQVEQCVGNGVVAEVEILQMYVMACLTDGIEEVGKLGASCREQFDAVVARHRDTLPTQIVHHQCVA